MNKTKLEIPQVPKNIIVEKWDISTKSWVEAVTQDDLNKYYSRKVTILNTSYYYQEKMKQENVYNDYISYMDSKIAYDKKVEKFNNDKQLAYQEEVKYNPDLTYEEFTETYEKLNIVMLPSYEGEPQPSEALKMFMEKYL